jgi:hypothetical protein
VSILFKSHAKALIELGYLAPVPTKPGAKGIEPSGRGLLHDLSARPGPTDEQIDQWSKAWPDAGIGMVGGWGLIQVDLDDEQNMPALRTAAWRILGRTPLVREGKAPKTLLVYRGPVVTAGEFGAAGELLGAGRQAVWFGVHPGTGQPYQWTQKSPLLVPFKKLPEVTQEQIDQFRDACIEISGARALARGGGGSPGLVLGALEAMAEAGVEVGRIDDVAAWSADVLASATPGERHDTALALCGVLLRLGATTEHMAALEAAFEGVKKDRQPQEWAGIIRHFDDLMPLNRAQAITASERWSRWR